jgi:hypothetical protein
LRREFSIGRALYTTVAPQSIKRGKHWRKPAPSQN